MLLLKKLLHPEELSDSEIQQLDTKQDIDCIWFKINVSPNEILPIIVFTELGTIGLLFIYKYYTIIKKFIRKFV